MTTEKVIEIRGLRKSFKDVKAVNDLSFCVYKGELFAFLGVNGAGKSTTISIMCGQQSKDGGEVIICGADADKTPYEIKNKIGVVFQNGALDKQLTVYDNLKYRAALYGITGEKFAKRYEELAKLLEFGELKNRILGKLSGGQRRRVDIARALFHKPEILILDEPTTGLDPQTRRLLWKIISDLRHSEKLTVFLTTHYMEEAADADRVVILDKGSLVAEGTPLELKNKYAKDYVILYGHTPDEVKELGYPFTEDGGVIKITVPDTASAASLVRAYPALFDDFEIVKGNMDDVFLAVTGKDITAEAE